MSEMLEKILSNENIKTAYKRVMQTEVREELTALQ